MNRVPLIVVAVAVSLLCIAGMGVIAMEDGGPETFRIEYVLNGGTNDPSNPVSYTSGDEFTLADASKDGMTFTGWYLDGDATDRFTAVTADTRGHLILHAGWEVVREQFSINYVLNGGSNNPLNPSQYTEGSETVLLSPTRNGMDFIGWFLDEGLTQPCNVVTGDMTGAITLYAGWTDGIVGTGFEMSINGTISEGWGLVYTVTGTMTNSYIAYDWTAGRYLYTTDTTLTYTLGRQSETVEESGSSWTGEDDDVTWSYQTMETIVTVDGERACHVYLATHRNSFAREYQWIGEDGTLYKAQYINGGLFSQQNITYTFVRGFQFEIETGREVVAYAQDGLTISGEGTYSTGDTVTLVASGDGFEGWYDSSGELLSRDRAHSVTVLAEDSVVYARCGGAQNLRFEKGVAGTTPFTEEPVTEWILADTDGGRVEGFGTSNGTLTFDRAGEYVLLARTDGGNILWDVVVGGLVEVNLTWTYDGSIPMTHTVYVEYDDVAEYRDAYTVDLRVQDIEGGHARDVTFATVDDPYVRALADHLRDRADSMALSDTELAELVLDFVQGVEYQSDDIYMGHEEYWKFPLETLYDGGGDCEDTAILCATLLRALGFESGMLILPGHMACIVAVDAPDGSGYVNVDGKRFYYCETTSTGFDIGDVPQGYANVDVVSVIVP